jgi:small subunit ribosomal protein S29
MILAAQEFVIDHFAYSPAQTEEGEEKMYDQRTLAEAILARMAATNADVLTKLEPTKDINEVIKFASGEAKDLKTLAGICRQATITPQHAITIYNFVMDELTKPSEAYRPPILMTVDNLDHWMGLTKYRDAFLKPIHAHQFTIIRSFLDLLFSSKTSLPHGGMILGARSASNNPDVPAFNVLTWQIVALNAGMQPSDEQFPLPRPYQHLDPKPMSLLDPAANTQVINLDGVSKQEAAALMEYYVLSGILKENITSANVAEKWALSGRGNVGELCRLSARARIDPEKSVTFFGTDEGIRMGQGEHKPKSVRDRM